MAAAPHIRPVQYRDLGAIARLQAQSQDLDLAAPAALPSPLGQSRLWHSLIKALSYFPNPLRNLFTGYVAETERGQIQGFIQIAPFNFSRSTWKVETVATDSQALEPDLVTDPKGVGSQLLRHCFQTVWEARTWILEIDIQANNLLALYRQNGFQPLAQLTYWSLAPERLQTLAHSDPDLPNLLPVSNADAALLYQLDCVAMPPLLRQVFDRHILDFKSRFLESLLQQFHYWRRRQRSVRGYVFEPQRKAAIGYFQLTLSEDGARPHRGELTVHPAYTWLYPKLLIQMSQLSQPYPPQRLELTSTDYQHEREEYLEQLGAERHRHTLLMSRSVWHKLKETKLERLQLAEVLQGLKPVSQAPIPSRLSLLQSSEAPETAPEDLPHQGWS